jgi:hypothetical protein
MYKANGWMQVCKILTNHPPARRATPARHERKETNMKYYVERVNECLKSCPIGDADANGSPVGVTKKHAIALAKAAADKYPNERVFVSWGRASDGQQGYLNPDGNHAITGEAW